MSGVYTKNRPGQTLVELMMAMASATLLMAGLASTIYISSRALDEGESTPVQTLTAEETIDDLMADLQYAIGFSERTANAVTFQVPDRDGDELPETIRYSWSGTSGDPLLMEYNGGPAAVLAPDVRQFDLTSRLRTMTGAGFVKGVIYPSGTIFEEFTEGRQPNKETWITLSKPAGTSQGDLLIAALATKEFTADDLQAPSGWVLIDVGDYDEKVSFGVWWKIAGPSESSSYLFDWDRGEEEQARAYGWIMRFTGHDPASPIHAWAALGGKSISPTSPSLTTTVDNAMILRLGGFKGKEITIDDPGLPGHTPITMDKNKVGGGGDVSGGAGYVDQGAAGSSGTSNFSLTKSKEYRTVTIAIAPAQ